MLLSVPGTASNVPIPVPVLLFKLFSRLLFRNCYLEHVILSEPEHSEQFRKNNNSAHPYCEVRSVIKFIKSITPIEIRRQLCQVYGQADGTMLVQTIYNMCMVRSAVRVQPWGACAGTSRPVSSIFSYTSRNSCPVRVSRIQRGGDECHAVATIPGGRLLRCRDTKVGLTVWQMYQFRRWIYWNIAQYLLCLFQ